MSKPRLLDLFCGAGGCSVGYARAGFEVAGVDIADQLDYPFKFVQMDALEFMRQWMTWPHSGGSGHNPDRFDAIHASPPCQAYAGSTAWRGSRDNHERLIAPTRELLERTGLPYVIENVPDARRELRHPLMLCGTGLGLRVRRHRYFELNWPWPAMQHPCHHRPDDFSFDHGGKQPESVYRDAMGVPWMTVQESREAVPPAYTELIGRNLLAHIHSERKAAA